MATWKTIDQILGQYTDPVLQDLVKNSFVQNCSAATISNDLVKIAKYFQPLSTSKISWNDACIFIQSITSGVRIVFSVFLELLNRNLYAGDSSDELYARADVFKDIMATQKKWAFQSVMIGEKIRGLLVFRNDIRFRDRTTYFVYNVYYQNMFYRNLMFEFLQDMALNRIQVVSDTFLSLFEQSLGENIDRISGLNDFTEDLFWHQVEFFRELDPTALPNNQYNNRMNKLVNFYRWLCKKDDYVVFDRARTMTRSFLESQSCINAIDEGYYITKYDPLNPPKEHDKYAFIFDERNKPRASKDGCGWRFVDMTRIDSKFYRDLFLNYYLHYPSDISGFSVGMIGSVMKGLHFFETLKQTEGHPTPDLAYLTGTEGSTYRYKMANDPDLTPQYAGQAIGRTRVMLQWAESNGDIKTDGQFFKSLMKIETPPKTGGNPIPSNEVDQIVKCFREKAEAGGVKEKHMLVMLHLGLATEMRMGSISRLHRDDLRPSVKPGKYSIHCPDKTSSQRKVNHEITEDVYKLLVQSTDLSDQFRDKCPGDKKDFVFLLSSSAGCVREPSVQMFSKYLKDTCKELGISGEGYTAGNIRDTHMAQAVQWAVNSGKTDLHLGLVTGHKSIDTTLGHYAGDMLREILEATYEIEIGDMSFLEAEEKIADSIDPDIQNDEHEVEEGRGYCTLNDCYKAASNVVNSIPCLVCSHFVTSKKQLAFFEQAVRDIDALLDKGDLLPHDLEDLTNMKRVYVRFIEAILMKNHQATDTDNGNQAE